MHECDTCEFGLALHCVITAAAAKSLQSCLTLHYYWHHLIYFRTLMSKVKTMLH